MDINNQSNINHEIPKTCWNIKKFNNNDSSINSVIVPTTDNRQNSTDFPSLKEASSKLNKRNEKKNKKKVVPPLLRNKNKKALITDVKVLKINNLNLNYQEYCSPIKKEFNYNKLFTDTTKSNNEKKEDLNKALVPYSPYGNYHSMFMPPPYLSLYQYWWKIPRCGFDIMNGEYGDDCNEHLKKLIDIVQGKDASSSSNHNEQELQNMINIIKTLNLKFCDMSNSNYDTSLYANSYTISKIKIKDIPPPNTKNHIKRKSKLVKLESIIPKKEPEVIIDKIVHLEDIFKIFQGIKVTNGPSSKYTILMHLLFYLTPRELCLMSRVCKSWRKELLDSKFSVDLWWNIWMNIVWVGKAQKEKEGYDKYLERSKSLNELSSLSSSRESLTSLSSLSLSNLGSSNTNVGSKISKKLMFPWYHTITRAERKRGTKVWIEKAVEEYRKTEVRGIEIISNPSSDEENSSESDEDSPKYQRPEGRGKLTSEEKNESRAQYKIMGSKPKTKKPWSREKGISKEWLFNNDLL